MSLKSIFKEKEMKKFFEEFKKFITRGNVLDMSVGVIVGGAFTAIVNGLSNFILKPIINWLLAIILGKNSLDNIVTFLGEPAYKIGADGVTKEIDLANSFYIDWGAFINAIINFLIIAFVLFTIVKIINRVKEGNVKIKDGFNKKHLDRNEKKELKANGVNIKDKEAVKAYFEAKDKEAELKAEEEKRLEEEKAAAERLANPTTEDLLKEILKEMKKGA
jgi:large conductance mechanosensitive channel